MKRFNYFFILVLTLAVFQSCQKEDDLNNGGEAPKIPSQETFIMPFDGFEEVDTLQGGQGNAQTRSGSFKNWFFAGTNILVWNTAVGLTMAVPVASFVEAFNHDPKHEGNGVYAWQYNFPVAGVRHTAKLTGEIINGGDDVRWIMTISKQGGFSDVVFYSGVVAVDRSEANWTLNHQPNNPQPFLNIVYKNDVNANEASIRYTNIIPGSADNGNYIEYRRTNDADLNRAYDVFDNDENNLIEMLWNEPSGEGRVKNEKFFGDSEWHCWDENKMDIDC